MATRMWSNQELEDRSSQQDQCIDVSAVALPWGSQKVLVQNNVLRPARRRHFHGDCGSGRVRKLRKGIRNLGEGGGGGGGGPGPRAEELVAPWKGA